MKLIKNLLLGCWFIGLAAFLAYAVDVMDIPMLYAVSIIATLSVLWIKKRR